MTEDAVTGISSHEALVRNLREVEGLRDKGKVHPAFHLKSRAFLHFHTDERGDIYADVRFNEDFEKVPAATPKERADLLNRVREHVTRMRPR